MHEDQSDVRRIHSPNGTALTRKFDWGSGRPADGPHMKKSPKYRKEEDDGEEK